MSSLSHPAVKPGLEMIDVGSKPHTARKAIASGDVIMHPRTLENIRSGNMLKGDVLTAAQLAGILAAKRTADLIPLCHPLPLTHVEVRCEPDDKLCGVVITATVRTTAPTGVEMEALTAVCVAALTIYDMAKAMDKSMQISNIRLVAKHGGAGGDVVNA